LDRDEEEEAGQGRGRKDRRETRQTMNDKRKKERRGGVLYEGPYPAGVRALKCSAKESEE